MTAEEIVGKLQGVTKTGDSWSARCPAHDDHNASLSVKSGNDGRALLKCHAGCEANKIVAALGLAMADLYPKSTKAAKRIVKTYPYTDALGALVYEVVRYEPKDFRQRRPDPAKPGNWIWDLKGVTRVLYRLTDVMSAKAAGDVIYVVEGEKDADALVGLGLCATCNAGGAGKWEPQYTEALKNAKVVVFPDKDTPGRKHAALLLRELNGVAESVKVVELPDIATHKVKDAADYIALGGTVEGLLEAVQGAGEWEWVGPGSNVVADDSASITDPVAAARQGKPYAMTDLGNAERLVAYHGGEFRWDVARKCWRVWDGRRWAADNALKVLGLASETARRIRQEAVAAPAGGEGGKDLGVDLFSWAKKSESRDRLMAMVEVVKSRPGVAVSADKLDADHWVLNVMNGTINLKTGELHPHNREDLITKLAGVEYRPGQCDERWVKFLDDCTGNDADLIAFLQMCAGYTLTGDTSEEKLFLVYGPEASGKTTFLETLRVCLGEYARTIQCDLLTRKRDAGGSGTASPELAALAGARLAAGSEMEQGREIAEALAKNLTGGESITARHLYADMFEFLPQFKLWLALNHCPKVSAEDGAIWRRILRIGFEHTVPKEKRDKTLKLYLRDPEGGAPAILAWAVEGCLRWQREGLKVPECVAKSTEAYRSESDPLAQFFEDCLQFWDMAWTPWSKILAAYNAHAEEMGVHQRYRVSPKRLQERLKDKGCKSDKRNIGRGWAGVEVKIEWDHGFGKDHGGHGGNGSISKTFSMKAKLEKVYGIVSQAPRPPCLDQIPSYAEIMDIKEVSKIGRKIEEEEGKLLMLASKYTSVPLQQSQVLVETEPIARPA